jgi:hypothetical protein
VLYAYHVYGAYPLELLLPQSDFQGKIFLRKNFHPFSGLDGWKLATNGGSWQHFYTHLNALKTARIESREDSKTLTVAEIGKNGVFSASVREALARGRTTKN